MNICPTWGKSRYSLSSVVNHILRVSILPWSMPSIVPTQNVSKIMQWLKGISSRRLLSEFPHLRKKFWGRHLWARGYLAVSSGNITDEMIQQYIEEQEGEPVTDDSRFPIDPSWTSRLINESCSVCFSSSLPSTGRVPTFFGCSTAHFGGLLRSWYGSDGLLH